MAPVLRIALRRLTRDRRRNILLAIAVLVSIAMLAFLAEFGLLISVSSGSAHNGLPFTSFLNRMRLYTYVAVSVIAVMTLLTIRIHCDTHGTENVRTLAVLTSTGATAWQKGQLIFTEYIVLYIPPLIIGTALGLPSGAAAADRFLRATGVAGASINMFAHVVLPALVILISGALLILACYTVPAIKIRKVPIISAVRSQNTEEAEIQHGYRQSQTFQKQALLKRLARKSVDYYNNTYCKLALSFSLSALYPVLAAVLLWHLGRVEVILDANPYDNVTTTAAVMQAIDSMFLFLGVGCAVLTCVGAAQTLLILHRQYTARRSASRVYRQIGMPEADTEKMIRLEFQSVLLRSFIYLIFGAFIIIMMFHIAAK